MQIRFRIPTVLGGALDFVSLYNVGKWFLDWLGRYDAARSIPERIGHAVTDFPRPYFILALMGMAFILWDYRRPSRDFVMTISPLIVAICLTVFTLGGWVWYI